MSTIVPMILAIATAITGVIAAVAAARSASQAAKTVAQADLQERKRLERELARIANHVVALSTGLEDLATQLKIALRTTLTFSGQSGNAKSHEAAVDEKRAPAVQMHVKATGLLEQYTTWGSLSSDEISARLVELEGFTVRLIRVHEKFSRDLDRQEADNRIYREQALAARNRP